MRKYNVYSTLLYYITVDAEFWEITSYVQMYVCMCVQVCGIVQTHFL